MHTLMVKRNRKWKAFKYPTIGAALAAAIRCKTWYIASPHDAIAASWEPVYRI